MMEILNIKADNKLTAEVMDFVETQLTQYEFPVQLLPDILIAAEEIFVNIANYAYNPGEAGEVEISVSVGEKAVLRFKDNGKPFDPLKRAGPDLNVPIMEREIGGLGIHFVKNMMDEAEYEYTGGKNILTISKSVSKQDRTK